jgi:nanoRNase/pAp phosphatase (c-di-AMP/oligoRNAs hydrolase)
VQSRAIAARDERSPYAVSDVGLVDNLDAIPQAADELMHLEGVTALVVGGAKDGTLHFSGRSRDDRVHIGRALEAAVEDIPMAGAGGHARVGGGQVSIDHIEGLGPSKGLTREEFHERLFDAMAGEE